MMLASDCPTMTTPQIDSHVFETVSGVGDRLLEP